MRRRHLDHPPDRPRHLEHPPPRTAEAADGARAQAPTRSTRHHDGGCEGRGVRAGIAALTQYAAREGRIVVPRTHVEETPHGPVRLGTWISNTRSRRNKLTDQQREQLAALGVDWATA
ncbi:helicase associated domain-containing protein [Streptomyces sp. ME02-6979.5a]|nr:helicase associated domain-containing protein [Streptomyces sp. ME02-6979.5a]MDX3343763.1 helicase associated domain-containing protein [Streptomyces sp. ME02-6979.5a]